MKIKTYKNKYEHDVIDCPFCSHSAYLRDATRTSPDPFRDLKRHITLAAKNEALAVALDATALTPHLAYYKEHTSEKKVVTKLQKREYDSDLSI